MKLIAKVEVKQVDAISNREDPRKVAYFHCKLYVKPQSGRLPKSAKPIAEGAIWSHTEQDAVREALAALTKLEYDIVRDGYDRTDFEWRQDRWQQLRVRTPEDAARVRESVGSMP